MKQSVEKWMAIVFVVLLLGVVTLGIVWTDDTMVLGEAAIAETEMMAGERTVKNFLTTALAPVGKVLWVTGGGWSYDDDGPDDAARMIGLSKAWLSFFESEDADYSIDETEPVDGKNVCHDWGLDADGYVGWAIYNTLYDEDLSHEGFVYAPDKLVESLEPYCDFVGTDVLLGEDPKEIVRMLRPGDFVIMPGRHMYIYLGGCSDGSFVVAHAATTISRTGANGGSVQISAVSDGATMDCEAYALVSWYMAVMYPEWNERYEAVVKDANTYLNFYDYAVGPEANGIFRWKDSVLDDAEGYRGKTAYEILLDIYG